MIQIILPISRPDNLHSVFNCLKELKKPKDTHILFIHDGDDALYGKILNGVLKLKNDNAFIAKFGDGPAESLNSRRFRISEIHNFAKEFVTDDCDYVFLIEDDTTYPADSLKKLIRTIESDDAAAFAEAVELGRRNSPYVGAWAVDNTANPTIVTSINPPHPDLIEEEIDAGGLYCCLVRADLYRNHTFEPLDKEGTNGLSCDVNFGLWMRRQGYKCLINWSILCDHHGDGRVVSLANTRPEQLRFSKEPDGWRVARI